MPSPWVLLHLSGRALAWVALAAALWLTLASAAFLWLCGTWDAIPAWSRPWQWAAAVQAFGDDLDASLWVIVSALVASTPFALAARYMLTRVGGLRLRSLAHKRPILRGTSDNHGHADWMSLAEMQGLFPPTPDPELGGVVVGEADRVDLGPVAGVPFDPDDRRTWGNGGRAPLLIDPCKRGSSHSMVIGGGGTYKSSTLVTSLLTWRGSIVCLDPAEEMADLVGEELANLGRKVVRLSIGGVGPNVLDSIDIESPLAETAVRGIVGRIIGPMPADDSKARFKKWGRSIITAFLAHLMWDPNIPRELKTLRALRAGLDGGEEAVRNRLWGISETSTSPLARSLASAFRTMTFETFSGAVGNATDDTEWLASSTYADLVSGDAYSLDELAQGNLVVFVQVPQRALEQTPAVARTLIGCHMDAVFEAKGRIKGRVFFPIDEAVLIGRDPALKIARDQGRKFGVTLQLFYQSEGQIEEVWTPAGKRAWFDGLSWRTYAGVQNLDSARELSATLGTYGVKAVSTGANKGRQGKGFERPSGSRGTSTSEHEISRELAKPHELLSDARDDERFTIIRNRPPMRHGAAIAFRRPEMRCVLGKTSYRRDPAPAVAAE